MHPKDSCKLIVFICQVPVSSFPATDSDDLLASVQIQAHKAPLAALAISSDGSLLASASERGTVIRVYTLPNATKVRNKAVQCPTSQ
jgi:hypothetical protein